MLSWDLTKWLRKLNLRWMLGLLAPGGIWLIAAVCDRLWLFWDRTTPAWDAADYLTGSLNYWNALQTPDWFSDRWWTNLWLLSSKIPPLVYLSTTPIIAKFGKHPDQVMGIFLVYSAILLLSVYFLGKSLFNHGVGLWAAGFCILMPVLYEARLEYLLDFPLAAMVTFAFLWLTLWREGGAGSREQGVGSREQGVGSRGQGAGSRKEAENAQAAGGERLDKDRAATPTHPSTPSLIYSFTHLLIHQLPYLARLRPWVLAIAAGISLGLALMTKQSAGLFLLIPIAWCGVEVLWQRSWSRVGQFGIVLLASLPIWFPWYRTNWLLILTSSKRATIDAAAIQGSPSLFTLDAWTFYLRYLPRMVSLPLLVVPLLGLMLFWRRSRVGGRGLCSVDYEFKSQDYRRQVFLDSQRSLIWILIFVAGAYLLSTLNPNKDTRYFAPCLPVLSVILAYGFTLLPRSWRLMQWGSVVLASLLMLATLFPLFANAHQPNAAFITPFFPNPGGEYPLPDMIAEVRKTAPYLRSTIGVLPSTPSVNQHNVNYFGLVQNFQVYGRQVGTRRATLDNDRRSLDWFLTKTGDQGSIPQLDIHTAMVKSVEQSNEFKLHKSWSLPDKSQLQLYHRQSASVEVERLPQPAREKPILSVQLQQVIVPAITPPGKAVPITYQWSGSWKDLHRGIVILTWNRQGESVVKGRDRWLHDHAIGMGMLYPEVPKPVIPTSPFRVLERLAMLPPADLVPGTYQLDVTYLDRQTGETTPLPTPTVTLQINPAATPTPAPELDLVSQLRSLAGTLPKGVSSLEKISNEINRINQYDPVQDYLTQAELAMRYRLQTEPKNRPYAYTLALATVLKRQVNDAIAALERVTQLDPKNPYAHAYLAFVKLYDFQARSAQSDLDTAIKLNPNIPELHALRSIAAVMRANFFQAWQDFQAYQKTLELVKTSG